VDTVKRKRRSKLHCEIIGCFRERSKQACGSYRDVCQRHWEKHLEDRRQERAFRKRFSQSIKNLSKIPCYNCGWNLSYTDRHRIKPGREGGKYTRENIQSLCPNCHRVETLGVIRFSAIEPEEFTYRQRTAFHICIVPNCTNKRANVGYGKYRSVCEKHYQQRLQRNREAREAASES
jgi:hypothetical protein